MKTAIRQIVARHAQLRVRIETVNDDDSLFQAGMSSFSSVQLLMALEEHFGIEFPPSRMIRATFVTINTIERSLEELHAEAA